MDEKIYTLAENGIVNGLEKRDIIHTNGILHLSVQCWVVNSMGQVLIQKRSSGKDQSAGKRDVSFGGHCTLCLNRDILIENVVKEGREELGLNCSKSDVNCLGNARYVSMNGNNRELLNIFLIRVPNDQMFIFHDGEVVAIKWVDMNELDKFSGQLATYANRQIAVSFLKKHVIAVLNKQS